MKALLIENNPELRSMIGAHLTSCGLTVDAFATGEEGRAALALSIYDILLLDLPAPPRFLDPAYRRPGTGYGYTFYNASGPIAAFWWYPGTTPIRRRLRGA